MADVIHDAISTAAVILAIIGAMAIWGVPFQNVAEHAKLGLRPEDKQRLLAACEETKEDKHE